MECELIAEFKTGATSGFDINFRELLSRAFAVHAWGERWSTISPICGRPRHVHFRIDNSSAIAWQNKMASRNPRAQVVILLLGWWETSYRLCFSASHITGMDNTPADAGSRIPANLSFARVFASLTPRWSHRVPSRGCRGSNGYLASYLRAHSVANSTFDQYKRALDKWRIWSLRRGIHPWLYGVSLTDQVHCISAFVLHGFQFGFGSGGPIRSDSISAVFHGARHFFAATGFHSASVTSLSRMDASDRLQGESTWYPYNQNAISLRTSVSVSRVGALILLQTRKGLPTSQLLFM
ncbi:hypothetical protein F441_19588 [Phytophthora nicotianae CJ01A1]|uniref:Uncharacterized protein n=1 Tax=Phytophthora nicotianae CJ01A1 TaxID=1317063 RepID=W2VYT8_PHYNI|nr:hypothetical protein F441_19588 [Phytophthora nicotianae CJ01A1]